jgi:hypothetical protein
MNHRFLGGDGRFGHGLGLYALVVGLFGDRLVLHQALAALEIGFGKGEIGPGLGQIGAHLLEHDLKRPPVDREKEVAFFHYLAVGEMNFGEIAGQARADIDRIHGHEPADIFVEIDHHPLGRHGHGDSGKVLRGGLLLALAAAGQNSRHQHGGDGRRLRRLPELHDSPLNLRAS